MKLPDLPTRCPVCKSSHILPIRMVRPTIEYRCDACRYNWKLHVDHERNADEGKSRTGLVCPTCYAPVAVVKTVTDAGALMRCPACGDEWMSLKPA